MKKIDRRLFFSIMVILAYLLSACSGAPASAQQSQDDTVSSVGTELSNANDASANSNSSNENESNANDSTSNSNDDQNANSNSANGNDIEQEVSGVVEAITNESITINGVTYAFADFTEFKDVIAQGNQVKLQVIVNADGTFTVREIEITDATGGDNGNSNDNSNSSNNNDNNNSNSNDNGNGNDDGGGNGNGNDDNGGDDNGNDNGGGGDDGGNGNGNG